MAQASESREPRAESREPWGWIRFGTRRLGVLVRLCLADVVVGPRVQAWSGVEPVPYSIGTGLGIVIGLGIGLGIGIGIGIGIGVEWSGIQCRSLSAPTPWGVGHPLPLLRVLTDGRRTFT